MTRPTRAGSVPSGGVLAVTLPDWLNTENVRNVLILVVVIQALLAWLVFRIVRAVVVKAALLGVIVVVAGAVWLKRADLGDCIREPGCGCEILGVDVPVPEDRIEQLPAQVRDRALVQCEVAEDIEAF